MYLQHFKWTGDQRMQDPDSYVTFTFFLPTSSSYKLPVLFSALSTCVVPKLKVPFEKKSRFFETHFQLALGL